MKRLAIATLLHLPVALLAGCASKTPYEKATPEDVAVFKKVGLPIAGPFRISQGPFGKASHSEPGAQYAWDFEVPLGTPVVAVEDGRVMSVEDTATGMGCDPKYALSMHNIKIEHADGTVAQYGHILPKVKLGHKVRKGKVIAETALNGWICKPHLHFSVFRSMSHLYSSPARETIPLSFEGVANDLLQQGYEAR